MALRAGLAPGSYSVTICATRSFSVSQALALLAYAIVAGAIALFAFAFAQLTERQTPRLRGSLKRAFGLKAASIPDG